jgi:cytochrome c oxidase subunit 2
MSFVSFADAMGPMTYMVADGPRAHPVARLAWGLTGISVAVILIIGVLLLVAVFRRRPAPADRGQPGRPPPVARTSPGSGLSWVAIGTGLSVLVLLASTVWTMRVLAAVGPAPAGGSLTIEITGHQWWWEARYLSDDEPRIFTTANEIHIPVGEPVRLRLVGLDVIHSFWIPALTGKTDVIPGQVNRSWIEAERPGIYRGQCGEYCGPQHAHMALAVVAQAPAEFRRWWDEQLRPAAPSQPETPKPAPAAEPATVGTIAAPSASGAMLFQQHCGICHSVRGTQAGGVLGPDLTHVMSRGTLAAGTLPNRPGYLAGWIANPQSLKPGSRMPNLDLAPRELTAIAAYVATLR